jgi:hypothetical protein
VLLCDAVPSSLRLWITNEDVLSFKTGLSRDELDFVWTLVADNLVAHYEQQHAQREPPLLPFASLLVTLYWLRHYPTTRCIAAECETSHTVIQEALDHCLDALFTLFVPACFGDSAIPHRVYHAGTLADVRLVVDSTFLILPHHSDAADRKTYYHMKSPTRQALKWQLCVTTDGVPWHISDVVHGSKADVTLLRDSGVLDRLPPHTLMLGDKGYIGEAQVITPTKKPRGGELKEADKKENKVRNGKRVVVENCFHEFKKWAVIGGEYRGEFREPTDRQRVTRIVHVVGAMVKRRLASHPLRAEPTATV